MKQWFCIIGSQQYGPVDEGSLRQWIAEGRLRPTDLVWREGMPEWKTAVSVPELFAAVSAPQLFSASGAAFATTPSMAGAAPDGTGGATSNRDLMAQARETLRDRWSDAVVFVLLYFLLTFGIQMVPYAGGCAGLILGGAFELGLACFFLTFTRRGPHEIGMLFHGFRNFGNALGAYLIRAIFVLGWIVGGALPGAIIGVVAALASGDPRIGLIVGLILAIVPAMVAAYISGLGYSLTFYLLADNPTLGPVEPIFQSWRMMRGHKAKLFCLYLRFIGWALLCLLTCGIGFLWLAPYAAVSLVRFYDDLRIPAAGSAIPLAMPAPPEAPAAPPFASPTTAPPPM